MMKALRIERVGELALVEIESPVPAPDQLLIETRAATICTSDLHDLRWNPFNVALPVVIGHEAAGVVVGMGADVRGFEIGDRIAAHPVHPCGKCSACTSGLAHLCRNLSHFGQDMQGAMAERFVVRRDRARKLPDHVSFAAGALAEPVCVCLEAVNRASLQPGDSLLIVGDGPFGVLMAKLAIARGLSLVAIAGRHPNRLAYAEGAVPIQLERGTDPLPVLSGVNPGGFNAVIHTVGGAEMVNVGLKLLKPRGRLVIFDPMEGETPVDLFTLLANELEIRGAVNDDDLFDDAIAALADPNLAIGDLVTHEFTLDDYPAAFELAAHGHDSAMKIAFVF
jgi:2-desacetyl-2-hydroxyethyl bacteriochlorophyllide A dehydrogenase